MMAADDGTTRARPDPSVRPGRVRWAAAAPFLVLGIVFSTYFVRIPSVKLELGVSDGQLGTLLVVPVLTGVATMQLTGTLVARFGSAPILRLAMVALPLTLIGLALAGDVVQFALVLLVFGAVDGLFDVSMNAHAVAAERAIKRHIMNGCHAAWSIGAAVGSALGGVAIKAGLTFAQHCLLITAFLVPLAFVAGWFMLPGRADRSPARPTGGGAARAGWLTGWLAGWTPRLLLLGGTGTVVMVTEVSVGNWSGIFLHDVLGASLAAASLGYIGFSVFQAAGRLMGDKLHERYGGPSVFRWSGVIAVVGLATVVLSPAPAVAVAGFSILGVGVSVLLPLIMGAAGHSGADSDSSNAAAALSKIATLTYSGMLVGPVVIGWSAEGFGLRATLAGLLVLLGTALSVGLRRI